MSSGLWSNDIRNWSERAQEQMTKNNPELVVFMIGTNDTTQVNSVDANNDGVEDWVPGYRAKVDREMQILIGAKHRQVIWLGAPTLGDQRLDAGAVKVDKVFQEEAKKFAPDVVYVDTYKLFEGPDGTYSRQIIDEHGNQISEAHRRRRALHSRRRQVSRRLGLQAHRQPVALEAASRHRPPDRLGLRRRHRRRAASPALPANRNRGTARPTTTATARRTTGIGNGNSSGNGNSQTTSQRQRELQHDRVCRPARVTQPPRDAPADDTAYEATFA